MRENPTPTDFTTRLEVAAITAAVSLVHKEQLEPATDEQAEPSPSPPTSVEWGQRVGRCAAEILSAFECRLVELDARSDKWHLGRTQERAIKLRQGRQFVPVR